MPCVRIHCVSYKKIKGIVKNFYLYLDSSKKDSYKGTLVVQFSALYIKSLGTVGARHFSKTCLEDSKNRRI